MTPTPIRLKPEMMWRLDPAVEEVRRLPGWAAFHRACGRTGMFFDHIERDGRRGSYKATAFTAPQGIPLLLVEGSGKTPLDALASAYELSGRAFAEGDDLLARMRGEPANEDEFAALLGPPAAAETYEDLIG